MDSAPTVSTPGPPADGAAAARLCARQECGRPVPIGRTGRPAQYCSRSCRSKVDRAKAEAREAEAAAAAPEPAAPVPSALAVPAPAIPAEDRWDEDGRYLLGLADALHRRLARFTVVSLRPCRGAAAVAGAAGPRVGHGAQTA